MLLQPQFAFIDPFDKLLMLTWIGLRKHIPGILLLHVLKHIQTGLYWKLFQIKLKLRQSILFFLHPRRLWTWCFRNCIYWKIGVLAFHFSWQCRVLLEQGSRFDVMIDNPFPLLCSWVVCVRTLPLVTLLPAHLQELAVMAWPATQTFYEWGLQTQLPLQTLSECHLGLLSCYLLQHDGVCSGLCHFTQWVMAGSGKATWHVLP